MAQKSRTTSPNAQKRAYLTIPRADAEARIQVQIEKGELILILEITDEVALDHAKSEYYTWDEYNEELLKRIVDTDELWKTYKGIGIGTTGNVSFLRQVDWFRDDVRSYIRKLESIKSRLELIPEAPGIVSTQRQSQLVEIEQGNRVFVVHGHDEEAKQSVARSIEKLGIEPVILHEQPNQGRTIIEKFEDYSDVSFSVVLLTPDDLGADKEVADRLRPRARQNVILELGFFIGKLGRNKVCALHKGNIEIPSDFSGILWIPMDDWGAWRFQLAKEMKAAGLDVDLNKL